MRPGVHTLIATVLVCVAAVGYTFRMPDFPRFFTGENDFLPRYTQARMVNRPDQFDIEAGYREQERIIGAHIVGAFNDRLPWQALLLRPLAALPYPTAYWLWIALNLACFSALARYWLLPRDLMIWGIVFLPASASLIVGQDSLFLTLCIAGVLLFADRGLDIPAGLLLALCMAKPHLFWLVPIAVVRQRHWKLLATAASATCALLFASAVVSGFDWPARMLGLLRRLSGQTAEGVARPASLFQFGVAPITIIAAALIGIVLAVAIWRAPDLQAGIGLAIVGGVLLAPHTAVYDLALLLVALPALRLPAHARWIAILLWTPLPYWAQWNGRPWSALLPALLIAISLAASWSYLTRPSRAVMAAAQR